MPARRGERGQVLLLALLIAVVLSGSLLLIGGDLQMRMRAARREADQVRVTALADAALAETLAEMARRPAYRGLFEREFGGGTIASVVRPAGTNRRLIFAHASLEGLQRSVRAEVHLTVRGPVVLDWRRQPAAAPPP